VTPSLADLLREHPLVYFLRQRVTEYYSDEANRKQFEEWYRQKYGKDYEWRQ